MTAARRLRRDRPRRIVVDARDPAALTVRLIAAGSLRAVPMRRRPNTLRALFNSLFRRI